MKLDATHAAAREYIGKNDVTTRALDGLPLETRAGYWTALIMADRDSPDVLARLPIRDAARVLSYVLAEMP